MQHAHILIKLFFTRTEVKAEVTVTKRRKCDPTPSKDAFKHQIWDPA